MGFPNVDLVLVKAFAAGFKTLQLAPNEPVADIFEDLDSEDRGEIKQYLASLTVTQDVRKRNDSERYLYIMPNFPLLGYPFPQIGVSLGAESTADKFMGDITGDPIPVTGGNGDILGYDQEKGYLAAGAWNIDVVCGTKPEAVWISRFCQYFICQNLGPLAQKGVTEVAISAADMRIEAQQTMQPAEIFTRRLVVTAKMANTWVVRLPPPLNYEVGINQAAP